MCYFRDKHFAVGAAKLFSADKTADFSDKHDGFYDSWPDENKNLSK